MAAEGEQGVLCGSEEDVTATSMDQGRGRETFTYDGREFAEEELVELLELSRKNSMRDSRVIETMKLIEGSYVLDVGCASGEWSRRIAEEKLCRVLGIDLLDTSIEIAKKFNEVGGKVNVFQYHTAIIPDYDQNGKRSISPASPDFLRRYLLSFSLQDGGDGIA